MLLLRILRPRHLRLRLQLVSHLHTSPVLCAPKLQTFKLADIGEGITECEVIRWAVTPSSTVSQFDLLCEVQSDKASVELTSPYDGVVTELLVQEGEIAKVGAGLCVIEGEGEDGVEEKEKEKEKEAPTPVQEAVPPTPPASKPEPQRRPHPLDPSAPSSSSSTKDTHTLATPAVRIYARTQGVDLTRIAPGSGRAGRIERSDVDAFLASQKVGEQRVLEGGSEAPLVVELGRTRAAMWRAMEKSLAIPHFGYSTTLDITALHQLLPVLKAHIPSHYRPDQPSSSPPWNPAHALGVPATPDVDPTGRYTRLTYLPFLLKALSRAMMEWPLFRSGITPGTEPDSGEKRTLTIRPHADIALALATPTGLYAPVLRAADTRSVYGLASDIARLGAKGRAVPAKLTQADFAGGATLSVSNVGAIGKGVHANPVLVPGGGVAIVALGRAEWVWDVSDRAWKGKTEGEEDEWPESEGAGLGGGARRLHLPVSWSADHRVVEGAELAAFVECWRGWVEHPGRFVGEGV
ncbi:CoA-dependent acyltransferase [Roridomyces roridus]|uniref:Dihydrolipoamide acetyltransferase component of pyruvate dehydrogenase complex n=1 Tax=Roridomyces roridus TaxID=1738132 RepID=A0AAD7BEG8_9AGAR|nr:CoA-dependent acyltransferase [Roridomyces roridus]